MEGAWMGHRIYLELARRARGSGARTLNALAAEQRRTAQRLAAMNAAQALSDALEKMGESV